MFTYKVDEEVELRLITQHDADEIFEMIDRSRDYLREWLGWLDSSTEVSVTKQFSEMNLKRFAEGTALDTAIVYNGKIVGKIGFNSINSANKTAYIGYMLDEQYQGRGIMTRATKAMLTIAFDHYHLQKVEIHVAEGNGKSRAIPERLGFVQEGTIRNVEWLYDHYVNHVVYGMLRKEWLK